VLGRKNRRIAELESAVEGLQELLARIGDARTAHTEALEEVDRAGAELVALRHRIKAARSELQPLTEELTFQRAGVFRTAAADHQVQLGLVHDEMKTLIKTGAAVEGGGEVTFNGSDAHGRRLVEDWSALMLRSYNGEAENCLRMLRTGGLDAARRRLDRAAVAIERLSGSFALRISPRYQALRTYELELTAGHLRHRQDTRRTRRIAS
jgi:chromosome segregation ATPase